MSDEDLSVDNQASSEAEGVSESEESQVAVENHFVNVMTDYYAKKAQVAAAAEKVKLSLLKPFKPVKLRKNLKKFRLQN